MSDDLRWDDDDYTTRCVDCGDVIATGVTLPGPRVCVPCAAGKPKPPRLCARCTDRPAMPGDGFCDDCHDNVLAEREAVIRKAKASGAFDAMVKKLSDVRWTY
ncbi:MAG TPA: hypothetical protein VJT67_07250 [Longimicrobiaceae bacterium]|nr:hypothetical protein [Longimicrobiaceae bacterium]